MVKAKPKTHQEKPKKTIKTKRKHDRR